MDDLFRFAPVIAWTVFSAIGAWYAWLGAREAHRDLIALHGIGNGRVMNAKRDLRNQSTRLGVQLAWVAIGIIVMLGYQPWWAVTVLVVTVAVLANNARLDLRDRRRVMAGL